MILRTKFQSYNNDYGEINKILLLHVTCHSCEKSCIFRKAVSREDIGMQFPHYQQSTTSHSTLLASQDPYKVCYYHPHFGCIQAHIEKA